MLAPEEGLQMIGLEGEVPLRLFTSRDPEALAVMSPTTEPATSGV